MALHFLSTTSPGTSSRDGSCDTCTGAAAPQPPGFSRLHIEVSSSYACLPRFLHNESAHNPTRSAMLPVPSLHRFGAVFAAASLSV